MNKHYFLLVFLLTTAFTFGQGYNFGIVYLTGYDFKVVAIPDFASSGNTDISDVGFTLMLPAGNADITNVAGQLGGRTWSTQEFDAAFLSGQGLGDGTRDAWAFNLPPGQTLLAHTSGQQIDLVSFTVTNSPVSGLIELLANSDPIAIGAGGVLNSFYNSNIDNTTTQDYFSSIESGLGSFDFSTLSISDPELSAAIKLFPNPASNYITIQSTVAISTVKLYNMIGEQVLESADVEQVQVRTLAAGLYFVELTDNYDRKVVRKILIER